jgi:PAS domain S-box-containing protein
MVIQLPNLEIVPIDHRTTTQVTISPGPCSRTLRKPPVSGHSSSGHALTDQHWPAIQAALITCTVVVLIEVVPMFWGMSFPYPVAFVLSAAPIVAALVSTLRPRVKLSAGERPIVAEQQRPPQGLQSLIQSLPLGVLMVDLTRNVVLSNLKIEAMLKHPPPEFAHFSCERIFYEDRSSFMPANLPLARALAGDTVIDQEVLYLRGDSTMVALRMNAAAVRDDAGEIFGAVLMLEDINQERQARQAAQELAALVSTSDDAIYSISMEGVILTWYQGAERVFGYTADEARYMSITMLVPPDREPEFRGALRAVRTGKHQQPFSTVLVRKDGSRVVASIRLSPLYGQDRADIFGVAAVTSVLEELAPLGQLELTQRVA